MKRGERDGFEYFWEGILIEFCSLLGEGWKKGVYVFFIFDGWWYSKGVRKRNICIFLVFYL